jgi:CubicO group peptidase (beta-lactamase class C family)
MKGLLKWLGVTAMVLTTAAALFLVWAYQPVPTFRPLAYTPVRPSHWPTEGWQRSTPEAQGTSAKALLDMIAFYQAEAAGNAELFIDSITIVRNGYIVAEYYPNPNFPHDELHIMHSATKSIISVLVGIAIEEGHIESVDAPVIDFFGDREIENLDERKKAVTIRDLLST